jgi:CheY-like chemotaxis protein
VVVGRVPHSLDGAPDPSPGPRWTVAETILIVEDEPEFADLVELWMGRAGYRTVAARTGPDALRLFYEDHPDLVILDVSLPGLDGWQIIARIREFSRIRSDGHRPELREPDPRGQARRRRLHHQALASRSCRLGSGGHGGPRPAIQISRAGSSTEIWWSTSGSIGRGSAVMNPAGPTQFQCSPTSSSMPDNSSRTSKCWARCGAPYDVDVHLLR